MRKHDQRLLMPEFPYYHLLAYASQSAVENGERPTGDAILAHKADTQTLSVYHAGEWHDDNAEITREIS